jgi:hypothetical protein
MIVIKARDLINVPMPELWDTLTGKFILRFDDGDQEVDAKGTLYSLYGWKTFHGGYPLTPLLKAHHVNAILKGKRLSSGTHLKLLGEHMWATHDAYVGDSDGVELRDTLTRLVYEATNKMYNELTRQAERDVVSIDITDFIEIMDHPDVAPTLGSLTHDQQSITRAYDCLMDFLMNPEKLPENAIVQATQAGLVSKTQILQCLGPRGYLTDINSLQFDKPIIRGYVQGMRTLYDSLIESRSAAKALYFSGDALKDAEYFSRKLQLLCQTVKTLHHGDCGSQYYLPWKVRGPEKNEEGDVIYDGDLKHIQGKYYFSYVTNKLEVISLKDKHLEGTVLNLRSIVSGCNHPDKYGICSTCFGTLTLSVSAKTNIGHLCSASMTGQSTQAVLSTKHRDGSSVIESIFLVSELLPYLNVSSDGNSYLISPNLRNKNVKIILAQDEVFGLSDISIVKDVSALSITRVSAISNIAMSIEHDGVVSQITIPIGFKKRLGSLTYDMLQHIKTNGYEIDNLGNISISLKNWDPKAELITLPMKHFNMGDHSQAIAGMIESRVGAKKDKGDKAAPAAILADLFELVNDKLSVMLPVLEVILYGAMVVDAENNNFDLPKGGMPRELGVISRSLAGRTLSGAMSYQFHRTTTINPFSFTNKHRPSSVMDVFMAPKETIMDL